MIMSNKYREEIVGKRFLSVSGFTKLKLGKINEWGWRAGFIRAATHKDNTNKDLQVLVEYDDVEWHRREWLSIYKDRLFHFFLVEQALVWSDRKDPFSSHNSTVRWPALSFSALVSAVDMSSYLQPIEFLVDRELAFRDPSRVKPFQDWDSKLSGVRDYPEVRTAVRRWLELQDGQRILLTTPSVLVGYRVEVYRAEGTTQWYTAVIIGYNEATRDLTVTDDTVLEEHNEDPALVQMRLIGDGVVESIMRGENVGITPRRSRSSSVLTQTQQQLSRVGRIPGNTGSGLVSSGGSSGLRNHNLNTSSSAVHQQHHNHHHHSTSNRKPRATSKLSSITNNTSSSSIAVLPTATTTNNNTTGEQSHHLVPLNTNTNSIPLSTSSASAYNSSGTNNTNTVTLAAADVSSDKGTTITKHTRKRKSSENEIIVKTTRSSHHNQQQNNNFNNSNSNNTKEDLENKQLVKRKGSGNNTSAKSTKKKTLEEVHNSRLKNVEIRVADCLQISTSATSTTVTTTGHELSENQIEDDVKEKGVNQLIRNDNIENNLVQLPAPDLKPEPPPPVEPAILQKNNTKVKQFEENKSNKLNEGEQKDCVNNNSTVESTTNIVSDWVISTKLNNNENYSKTTNNGNNAEIEDDNETVKESLQINNRTLVDDCNSNSSNSVQILSGEVVSNITKSPLDNEDNNNTKSNSAFLKHSSKNIIQESSSENNELSVRLNGTNSQQLTNTVSNDLINETTTISISSSLSSGLADDDEDVKLSVISSPSRSVVHTTNNQIRSDEIDEAADNSVTTEEEEDCVIVEPIVETRRPPTVDQHTRREQPPPIRECSSRDDDDGPLLSSTSPFSRMELTDPNSGVALLRFADDRSDSGVSSLRSGSCASGDERSGSRSSALSSSDEPQTTSSTAIVQQHSSGHQGLSSSSRSPFSNNSSNSHLSVTGSNSVSAGSTNISVNNNSGETVRVWRDPSLLLETEPHVRHIDSVQHQSLLMSHSQAQSVGGANAANGAASSRTSGSEAPQPPTAQTHPANMYQNVPPPPPPLLSQYPLHHHAAAAAAAAAHHLPLPDMLWKRYHPPLPVSAHLLVPPAHPATEELIERERAYAHDRERLHRERREQEVRELEKQHKEREKERERIERERERQEREKMEREREKQMERERQDRMEQERERQEKQRAAEQAVHKHFEESLLRLQKRSGDRNMGWINTLQPPQRTSSAEEERKRAEQEHQQREQQRQIAAAERLRHEARERAYYSQQSVQRSPNIPNKNDYPPPAHSRSSGLNKPGDKLSSKHSVLPQAEPNLSIFNYPAYQTAGVFLAHPDQQPKSKSDHHKSTQPTGATNPAMLLGKSTGISIERDRGDLVGPPPLLSEIKNSVIVKHEGKSSHHMEPKVSHSPSPKLRTSDMMQHYLPSSAAQQHKSGLYEYRSPSQSPHHAVHPHAHSPHGSMHSSEQQKSLSHGGGHHRSSSQLPSPHAMQRHSPHTTHHHSQQPHPSPPESRYSRTTAEAQILAYPPNVKPSVSSGYPPYLPQPPSMITSGSHYSSNVSASSSSSKSKINSAPPHIYGKPSAGIVSGIPVSRSQELISGNPIPMSTKISHLPSSVSPSPYQQVSQYHPPQPPPQAMPPTQLPPPPAHSSRTTNSTMYDRLYPGGSIPGLSAKPIPPHHGTSPPSASAAPPSISRSPHQHHLAHSLAPPSHHAVISASSVQTQPLDLGVSSMERNSNREQTESPKRKNSAVHHPMGSPIALDIKKRRIESPNSIAVLQTSPQSQPLSLHSGTSQPQLARVSEPSPLIASAATTITTVVNTAAYCSPAATIVVSQPQPAGLEVSAGSPMVSITTLPTRPESADAVRPSSAGSSGSMVIQQPQPSVTPIPATTIAVSTPTTTSFGNTSITNTSPAPSPVTTTQSVPAPTNNIPVTTSTTPQPPNTPVKTSITPSVIDSEKSNSPGPTKTSVTSGNYPVRHLKKAWLQRHTGEDIEDTTGITGTGSCVTLPITLSNNATASTPTKQETTTPSPSLTTSLHNIGSMAVNSINKSAKGLSNKGNRKPASTKDSSLNGHATDSTKADDSSSSDQERGRKSPPKRKPPKVKRKKGGGAARKSVTEELKKKKSAVATVVSESGSDSDKDTGSDKDSDSGASTTQNIGKKTANGGGANNHSTSGAKDKEPRKRGRRPKSSKNDKGEEPRNKKSREEPSAPPRDPFRKPPVGQLKKTGESFLQDGPCFEVAPKLAKCRECRWTPNQRSKNMPNIFCRFYAFRRLRYTKNGQLAIAGFSDPYKDASEDDLKLWLPMADSPPADLDQEMSRFLLRSVGDQFCDLLIQEKEAHAEHMSDDKVIAWKRVVQGVREMCDVCETTLFNFHWACGKCGFVVCIDCYKGRKNETIKVWGGSGKDRDEYSWLLCTNRSAHEQEKLMLTQIIAGDSLMKLGRRVHEARELWNIPQYCECPLSKEVRNKFANGASKDAIKSIIKNETNGIKQEKEDEKALSNEDKKSSSSSDGSVGFGDSDDEKDGNFSTLRELLIRPSHKTNGSRASSPGGISGKSSNKQNSNTLEDVISMVVEDTLPEEERKIMKEMGVELKHYIRRHKWDEKGREPLPVRLMTLTESREMYPDVPHSWLCDGKLLRLKEANNPKNYKIFQDQWKRGQPVIVSDVTKSLNKDLWHPDSFARDFGDDKNDLINCMTGNLVPNQPMRKFWEGFEHFSKRLKDDRGNPMLLKLKDWPPGEDFAEMLPTRYTDLMKVLPLSEYTHRTGRLNLASRLPECFVRPDLGPKMYNAYGSALYPTKGTTNLHLDVSDAVNVMVYVGIPKDGDNDEHIKEAFRAIDEAGCDILTRRRVRDSELPGALWHIYHARDADKIRDLLNKVAIERGARLEPHHDPIHDQSCYLDGPLRERLYKEYNVEGYAIVQCLGDAVFIPAGAPHQVRNLHNCIKVAEDFVSPENISHCFHLTQEFRHLSDTHTNHEDKLQIKNIIYHAVKDSLSVLSGMLDTPRFKTEVETNATSSNGSGNGGDTLATGVSSSSSDTNSSAGSPASADAENSKETNSASVSAGTT